MAFIIFDYCLNATSETAFLLNMISFDILTHSSLMITFRILMLLWSSIFTSGLEEDQKSVEILVSHKQLSSWSFFLNFAIIMNLRKSLSPTFPLSFEKMEGIFSKSAIYINCWLRGIPLQKESFVNKYFNSGIMIPHVGWAHVCLSNISALMDNVRSLPWRSGVCLKTESVIHDYSDGFGDHTTAILCT